MSGHIVAQSPQLQPGGLFKAGDVILRIDPRDYETAVKQQEAAGARRLRPILLTSLTTFCGLAPMIFETSVQAQFLIPMAVSLGFGVLFVTFIALLLVPALYLIVEDGKSLLGVGVGRDGSQASRETTAS